MLPPQRHRAEDSRVFSEFLLGSLEGPVWGLHKGFNGGYRAVGFRVYRVNGFGAVGTQGWFRAYSSGLRVWGLGGPGLR